MLQQVPDRELRALVDALEAGRARTPLSSLALESLGLAALSRVAQSLAALDAPAWMALARAVLAERAAAPQPPELVWTGPEGVAASARRTEAVFYDLLASAQRDVWMAGYSIDHGEQLFAPLHSAMVERGVRARFILNLQYAPKDRPESTVTAGAALLIHRFFAKQWPFEGPKPAVYYDPRTLKKKVFASMHAKLVIVDEKRVLIGSANFTQRGHERNIEAGVMLHDGAFARQLVTQLRSLIDGGHIVRYGA